MGCQDLETQLREDDPIKEIENDFRGHSRTISEGLCPDCELAKAMGLGQTTCTMHAPEFKMRIDFPL